MIALLQMQNITRFIKYIQRSKPYANQFRNVLNTNISYLFNVKTIYLPSQRSYPLKQGNATRRAFIGTFEIFIALGHNLKAHSFAQFIRFQLITTGSFVLVSDISVRAFGKKHRLVHKMCPNPCSRHLTNDIW
jgi:hypothetical protein